MRARLAVTTVVCLLKQVGQNLGIRLALKDVAAGDKLLAQL